MEKNVLVSIIIAAYNSEKYIANCIESVLNQTYERFELIIIDDGSTDNTRTICEKYKEKDCRIIYIYQELNKIKFRKETDEFIYTKSQLSLRA